MPQVMKHTDQHQYEESLPQSSPSALFHYLYWWNLDQCHSKQQISNKGICFFSTAFLPWCLLLSQSTVFCLHWKPVPQLIITMIGVVRPSEHLETLLPTTAVREHGEGGCLPPPCIFLILLCKTLICSVVFSYLVAHCISIFHHPWLQ